MKFDRPTAADRTWREKSEDGTSIIGIIAALALIGLPLFLL